MEIEYLENRLLYIKDILDNIDKYMLSAAEQIKLINEVPELIKLLETLRKV